MRLQVFLSSTRRALFSTLLVATAIGHAAVTPSQQAEAAKANNLGTAMMNQQLLEKAAAKFADAYQLDPALIHAEVNRGIALVYLQKMPEAEQALKQAAPQDPKDPHIWYALGILYRIGAQYPEALESFQKVAALDPDDADTHYFLGSVLLELRRPDEALTEFQTALRLSPTHASAQCGLAKVLQRLGKREEAATAFHRFETLNQEKIGAPLAHTYGDEGHYSLVQDAPMLNPQVGPMIPVTFSSQPLDHQAASPSKPSEQPRGGACLVAPAGEHAYLLVMASGEEAIRTYAQSGSGSFTLVPSAQTGLVASGIGVACTVGDFDNDGIPDVAVAMSDRVLLFKNHGGGKFSDVTATAGLQPAGHPAGITFVDY